MAVDGLFDKMHKEFREMLQLMQHWTFSNKLKIPDPKAVKPKPKPKKRPSKKSDLKKRRIKSEGEQEDSEIDSRLRTSPFPFPISRHSYLQDLRRMRTGRGGRSTIFADATPPLRNSTFLNMIGRHRENLDGRERGVRMDDLNSRFRMQIDRLHEMRRLHDRLITDRRNRRNQNDGEQSGGGNVGNDANPGDGNGEAGEGAINVEVEVIEEAPVPIEEEGPSGQQNNQNIDAPPNPEAVDTPIIEHNEVISTPNNNDNANANREANDENRIIEEVPNVIESRGRNQGRRGVIRSRSLGTNSLGTSAYRHSRGTQPDLRRQQEHISSVLNRITTLINNQNNISNNINNNNNNSRDNQNTSNQDTLNQHDEANQLIPPGVNSSVPVNPDAVLRINSNGNIVFGNRNSQQTGPAPNQIPTPDLDANNNIQNVNHSQANPISISMNSSVNHLGLIRMNAANESITVDENNLNDSLSRSVPQNLTNRNRQANNHGLLRTHFSFSGPLGERQNINNSSTNNLDLNRSNNENNMNSRGISTGGPVDGNINERVNLPISNFENLRERMMGNHTGRDITRDLRMRTEAVPNSLSNFRDSITDLEDEVRNLQTAFIDLQNTLGRPRIPNESAQEPAQPAEQEEAPVSNPDLNVNIEQNQDPNNTQNISSNNQLNVGNLGDLAIEQNLNPALPNSNIESLINIENSYNPPNTRNSLNTDALNPEANSQANMSYERTINFRLDQNTPPITLPESRTDPRSNTRSNPRSNPDPNPNPNPNTLTNTVTNTVTNTMANTTPNPEVTPTNQNIEAGPRFQDERNLGNLRRNASGVLAARGPESLQEQGIRRRNGYMTYFDGDIPEELRLFFMNLGNNREPGRPGPVLGRNNRSLMKLAIPSTFTIMNWNKVSY